MKRSIAIDWMKALCILYIVGFWHLFNYTQAIPQHENRVTHEITIMVLGLFTLVSGYLMGTKDISFTKTDISGFFKKRLLRIYPPYLGTIAIFAIVNISPLKTLLLSIIPVSLYTGNAPLTLWYIVMLLSFYILAPFLLTLRKRTSYFIGTCLAIEGSLCLLATLAENVDPRNAIYFPCFATGLLLSGHLSVFEKIKTWKYLSVFITLAILVSAYAFFLSPPEQALSDFDLSLNLPIALICALTLFALMMKYEEKIPKSTMIEHLSYASFFLYLCHRPIYKPMTYFLMPESSLGQVLFLLCICLPMAILCAWTGQKLYDYFLKNIIKF